MPPWERTLVIVTIIGTVMMLTSLFIDVRAGRRESMWFAGLFLGGAVLVLVPAAILWLAVMLGVDLS